MHLLYLDDSGSPGNSSEDYFVLGGLSVPEANTRWLSNQLNELASSIDEQGKGDFEFHAAEIFKGASDPWKAFAKDRRKDIIKQVLSILYRARPEIKVFAVAVHKRSYPRTNVVELAYDLISDMFNTYLERISSDQVQERGLIIMDKTTYEANIQKMSITIRQSGNRRGKQLRSIIEIPMFVDSSACRIIQLADHIAYAVFRRYNSSDLNYFNCIEGRIDCDKDVYTGLSHRHAQYQTCTCPACLSQRKAPMTS